MRNKIPIKKIVLGTVATAGLVGVAVLTPNVLQVIGNFLIKRIDIENEMLI